MSSRAASSTRTRAFSETGPVPCRTRETVAIDSFALRLEYAYDHFGETAYFEGRDYILPEDIKEVAMDVMNHRIILNYEAEADNVRTPDIIKALLTKVPINK